MYNHAYGDRLYVLDGNSNQHPEDTTTQKLYDDIFSSTWALPVGGNDKRKTGVPVTDMEKPKDAPAAWEHPPASWRDGKCGITGVSNLIRWYGEEKNPKDIDIYENRSWGIGMRSGKFAEDCSKLTGKNFTACSIEKGEPLDILKQHLKDGKPVAIMYMTGKTNAHWVVVTGIEEGKDGPSVQVETWGHYGKIKWSDLKYQWERGYGGPYPYVVGDEPSPLLKKK